MSSATRTVLSIPDHKKSAQIAPLLTCSVSGVWKTGFYCPVSATCSLATHDNSSLFSHDILCTFIITCIFFSSGTFSIHWNLVLRLKQSVCSAMLDMYFHNPTAYDVRYAKNYETSVVKPLNRLHFLYDHRSFCAHVSITPAGFHAQHPQSCHTSHIAMRQEWKGYRSIQQFQFSDYQHSHSITTQIIVISFAACTQSLHS